MSTDREREIGRTHYHRNKEKRKAAAKAWKEKNRERYNAYMRELRAKKP